MPRLPKGHASTDREVDGLRKLAVTCAVRMRSLMASVTLCNRLLHNWRWHAISNLPFDLLYLARGSVSFFDRVGFGHVFALLRCAVKTRAFPVVNMQLGVNPHETVAPALCGCVRRWSGHGGLCGRWARGRWTRSRWSG
jgi:hypothetical protein